MSTTRWISGGTSLKGGTVIYEYAPKGKEVFTLTTPLGRGQKYSATLAEQIVLEHNRAEAFDALVEAIQSLINNNGTGAMEWAINNAQAALRLAKGG